jgi:protein kinase C substrate 80K-H
MPFVLESTTVEVGSPFPLRLVFSLPALSSASDIESKAVTDAKTLVDAERDLTNTKNEITRIAEDLEKEYDPDFISRALKGQWISKESREYTYELCFMSQTKQKPKKAGADTNMSNFVSFDTEIVDDDVPTDGKGLGKGERLVMKYENGQYCRNEPNRSTRVVMACTEKDEIWKTVRVRSVYTRWG